MRFGFRSKLIVSYAAVILVTLLLASLLFWVILQQIQQNDRTRAEQRLSDLTQRVAFYLAREIPGDARGQLGLSQYQNLLSTYGQILGVRILLIDSQHNVDVDTGSTSSQSSKGQKLDKYQLIPRDNTAHSGTFSLDNVNYLYYAQAGPCILLPNPALDNRVSFQPPLNDANRIAMPEQQVPNCSAPNLLDSDLLLAVPENTINTSFSDILQWLVLAALAALIVAIVVAYFIARSISLPLIRMTRASEAIAKGDYTQQLPVSPQADDEIGRLGHSFNHMTREVARNQQTMRDLVANVSHELKTPLTSIQGFSQALLDGTAEDSALVQHSADVIHSEAARMRRLVEELLDLSRLESGQAEWNWIEVDLKKLLERVVVKLEPLATHKNIEVKAHLGANANPSGFSFEGEQIWPVYGDSDRLEQIFTNLLDNAIKYAPANTAIEIKLEAAPAAKVSEVVSRFGALAVSISNGGPLIPDHEIPRIFERFYKLDKSRARRRGDSTGLGLAIVSELVEAHHGQIQVESEPSNPTSVSNYQYAADGSYNSATDNLTTFRVYLPLSRPLSAPGVSSNYPVATSNDTPKYKAVG